MASQRESNRIKANEARRVLDDVARKRRQRKALEALEQDNYQDDPHADLKMSKKAPKFEETVDVIPVKEKKPRRRKGDALKYRFRRNIAILLEEEHLSEKDAPNYLTACVPASNKPERKFCAVCGFPSTYTCVQCGARYCCVRCLGTHQDTRCLKWVG